MTKNIIVLVRLLEHGEVSTNDFAGLEKVNVRHLPKIIFDARKFEEIYSENIFNYTTMQIIGVKYKIAKEQEHILRMLIVTKIQEQLIRKKINQVQYAYLINRIRPW